MPWLFYNGPIKKDKSIVNNDDNITKIFFTECRELTFSVALILVRWNLRHFAENYKQILDAH